MDRSVFFAGTQATKPREITLRRKRFIPANLYEVLANKNVPQSYGACVRKETCLWDSKQVCKFANNLQTCAVERLPAGNLVKLAGSLGKPTSVCDAHQIWETCSKLCGNVRERPQEIVSSCGRWERGRLQGFAPGDNHHKAKGCKEFLLGHTMRSKLSRTIARKRPSSCPCKPRPTEPLDCRVQSPNRGHIALDQPATVWKPWPPCFFEDVPKKWSHALLEPPDLSG